MPQLILQVCPGGLEHGGGIGRMVGYLTEAWRNSGRSPRMRVIDSRGTGHIVFAPWHFGVCLLRIVALSPQRPLLHVHVAGRGSTIRKIVLIHLARLLRLPVVLHLHDYNYRESIEAFPKLIGDAIPPMFRSAKGVVVLGADDRQLVIERLGVDPARVTILHNAVPAPAARTRCAAGSKTPINIVFLGNPSRRKGLHDLIAALGTEPLRQLPWRMTVAGGGGEIETFREQARDAQLAERITFTGWISREKTAELLDSAHILALPSYAEGMAMSVLEGLSYSLCVVCTQVGSLQHVIENGVNGLAVTPGNIAELSQALIAAVSDCALRDRLGKAAAKTFAEKFDAARLPERLELIYQNAAAA